MNIIDLSLLFNGYPVFKAKKHLKSIQGLEELELEKFILNQRKSIVSYHIENTPFYKNKIKNHSNWKWEDLPVLNKGNLQTKLVNRTSQKVNLKECYTNKTSGSTGDPFFFAKDKFTHALTWAIIENRFNKHKVYGKKQARFYGLPKGFQSKIKERIKDFFSNRYRFNVFDLSEKSLESWVLNFVKNKYQYINGYTTVIVFFAKYLVSKNIVLKDICPTLKVCVVTSEMCTNEDRGILEKGLGIKVVNEYGASELDLIAFEDENYDWVINRESLFIEILDTNNKPLPNGQKGKIVITSLFNKANPFIRYEIGDLGVLDKKGSKVILKELLGRKEDMVYLPSGKVAPGLTFYYITKSIMEDNGNVKEIKVIQKEINKFEIIYSSDSKLKRNQLKVIEEALYEYLETDLKIDFIRKDKIERSKSGKLKQFKSLLKK